MKLPVFKALGASLAYLLTHSSDIVKALWLPVLGLVGAQFYIMPVYFEHIEALATIDPNADPSALILAMGPMWRSIGLLYLAMAVFWPMTVTGVLRHLIRGESPRLPFYLQFGMDEVRVLVTQLLVGIMLALVYVVAILGALALGFAFMAVDKTAGVVVVAVAMIACLVALVWFMLRLSVVLPAAVGVRAIGLAQSWRLTKGAVWGLFFYYLIWVLFVAAIMGGVLFAAMPTLLESLSDVMASAQHDATGAEAQRKILEFQSSFFDASNPRFYLYAGVGYLGTMLQMAIVNVSTGVAYRCLADAEK